MRRRIVSACAIVVLFNCSAMAQLELGGFLQTLHGARLDASNPIRSDFTVSETRLQLRAEHFGDQSECSSDHFYKENRNGLKN